MKIFFSFLNLEQPCFPIKKCPTLPCCKRGWPSNTSCHSELHKPQLGQAFWVWNSQTVAWLFTIITSSKHRAQPSCSSRSQVILLNFWLCGLIYNPPTLILSSPKSTKSSPCMVKTMLCSRLGSLLYNLVPPVTGCGLLDKWISLPMPRFSCLYKKHHSPYLVSSWEA